jgi:hypothetical protein
MITQTFEYTGGTQTWVVPQGVTRVTIEAWGGQGFNQSGTVLPPPGGGGYVKADVNVTPGTMLGVWAGQAGPAPALTQSNAWGLSLGGIGGQAGGGSEGAFRGGGGGAASGVAIGTSASTNRLVVAGGGGGGTHATLGGQTPIWGGPGGGSAHGMNGANNVAYTGAGMGGGGRTATATAVGAGGTAGHHTNSSDSQGTTTAGTAGQASGTGGSGGQGYGWRVGSGGGGGGHFGGGGGGGGSGRGFDATPFSYTYYGVGGAGGGGSSFAGHANVVTGTITMTAGVRSGNGRVVISYKELAPSVPTNITPAAGAVLNVADPTLTANFTVSVQQARAKVEWTLANDPGFTENARVYTQPDSALQRGAVSAASYRIGSQASDQLLSQGTWYIRARTIDENGTSSAFSGSQSFRVEYPPTTINHFPTGNVAVAYVTAGNVFAWDFISPSPNNDQFAYQVVVETNAGVVIRDTGRVEGVPSQTSVAIPSARKGEQLRWRVRVWDSDNIQGPYSDYQLFRVVDGPIVAIDSMTTVNTANPTVTFTATPPVNSTITQKRLYITRDSDNSIVYDSGWQ